MAKKTISAGIAIDGEAKFKNAIKGINTDLTVLKSELKKVQAQFSDNADSMEALTASQSVYERQIDSQKEKISTLKSALENARAEYGNNSKEVNSWQIQLNNAEADLSKLEHGLEATNKELDEVGKKNNKISGLKDAFEKTKPAIEAVAKVAAATAKAVGAVVAAAAGAAVKLTKDVVEEYSQYEQLVGGIDTLFKESSDKVQQYAADSYKNSGLSANKYMETVTGFSASLISSLNGDTDKAASLANKAIVDMSDNANKMGTDITSIQNAYQGFAKQQYNMLDNLKLGYGGTKEEMQRLLKDATALSGVKYDINNFSDVVLAIHEIQDNLGIAGATALEAETTIEGSMNSLKASAQNLITGLGDSNANVKQLVSNVADSFKNVLKNITPVIKNIISVLPTAFDTISKEIINLLPGILSLGGDLINNIITTVTTEIFPNAMPVIMDGLILILKNIITQLPNIIESIGSIAGSLIAELIQLLAQEIPVMLPLLFEAVLNAVCCLIEPTIQLGSDFVSGLWQGIKEQTEWLNERISEFFHGIGQKIKDFLNTAAQLGGDLISGFWQGIKDKTEWLRNKISGFFGGVKQSIKDFFGIRSPSKWAKEDVSFNIIYGFANGFEQKNNYLKSAVLNSLKTVKETAENYAMPSMEFKAVTRKQLIASTSGGITPEYSGKNMNNSDNSFIIRVIELLSIIAANTKESGGTDIERLAKILTPHIDNELGIRYSLTKRGLY